MSSEVATALLRCRRAVPNYQMSRARDARRLLYLAAGKCPRCGKRPVPGRTLCPACNRKDREYRRKRLGRLKCGMCRSRTRATLTGLCRGCAKINRERARVRRRNRALVGICTSCGQRPPAENRLQCSRCLRKAKEYNRKLRDAVFAAYGGYVCACCGSEIPQHLEIDHIDGDGAMHRLVAGPHLYIWLRKHGFPSGFQVLCRSCNFAKHVYGACPCRQFDCVTAAIRKLATVANVPFADLMSFVSRRRSPLMAKKKAAKKAPAKKASPKKAAGKKAPAPPAPAGPPGIRR